jgi:hypothetical protein
MQAEIKDTYWKIFDTAELKTAPGAKLVEIIDSRIDVCRHWLRVWLPNLVSAANVR